MCGPEKLAADGYIPDQQGSPRAGIPANKEADNLTTFIAWLVTQIHYNLVRSS